MANGNGALPNPLKPLADTARQMTEQLNIGVKSLGDNVTQMATSVLSQAGQLPGLPALPGMPAGNSGKAAAGLPALPGLPDLTKTITSVEDLIPPGLPRPSAILTGKAGPLVPPTPPAPTAQAGATGAGDRTVVAQPAAPAATQVLARRGY